MLPVTMIAIGAVTVFLVHGVLARELRRTIAVVGLAAAQHTTLEDRLVEATLAALGALEQSVVDHLLRSDPATILPDVKTLAVLARTLHTIPTTLGFLRGL